MSQSEICNSVMKSFFVTQDRTLTLARGLLASIAKLTPVNVLSHIFKKIATLACLMDVLNMSFQNSC